MRAVQSWCVPWRVAKRPWSTKIMLNVVVWKLENHAQGNEKGSIGCWARSTRNASVEHRQERKTTTAGLVRNWCPQRSPNHFVRYTKKTVLSPRKSQDSSNHQQIHTHTHTSDGTYISQESLLFPVGSDSLCGIWKLNQRSRFDVGCSSRTKRRNGRTHHRVVVVLVRWNEISKQRLCLGQRTFGGSSMIMKSNWCQREQNDH